jgi:hypothetical protein
MLVNDEPEPVQGRLTLTLESRSGRTLAQSEQPFAMPALGAQTCAISLAVPRLPGDAVLRATATVPGSRAREATVSRRWVRVGE